MKLKMILTALATAMALFGATAAVAHGGGTNKDGCHNERKTGGYHCH